VDELLALAPELVDDLVDADGDEARLALAGDGARDEGLAAARWSVEEDAAAAAAPEGAEHGRVLEGGDDLQADLALDVVEPGDVGEGRDEPAPIELLRPVRGFGRLVHARGGRGRG
jgi:hypothetical protein